NKVSWIAAALACTALALCLGAAADPSPAAQLIARAAGDRPDVPRVELAARLMLAGLATSPEFAALRENAARELAGRPDGGAAVSAAESAIAEAPIARHGAPPSFCALAHASGRPQILGLRIVYLHPLGDPAAADRWRNIIAHQTEGPAGATRNLALAQFANPTKRGVMLWVETDGTVY